jgi:hypothetical protein
MAKLTITIEEKTESIENNRTLYGFGVTEDIDLEGSELSLLPSMGPMLTDLVMSAIALIQATSGGHLHKVGTCDRSIPLDSHMAKLKTDLAKPFPSEL